MASAEIQDAAERRRGFSITENVIDTDKRTAQVAFSTEKPVLITDRETGRSYLEILDHGDGVNMGRMSSAPVLKDHDKTLQVGKVERAKIDTAERVGRATLKFSKRQLAEEEWIDVQEGIRSNVSVGYIPGRGIREPESDQNGVPAFRFPNWTPYEISTVSVPEDESTGVGRSFQGGAGIPAETEGAEPQQTKPSKTMAKENEQPGAVTVAEPSAEQIRSIQEDARKHEIERANGIRSFAKRASIADSEVDKALADGVEFETFTRSFAEGKMATVELADGPKAPMHNLELGMDAKDRKRFSVVKALRDLSDPRRGLEGLEKEVSDAAFDQMKLGQRGVSRESGVHIPLDIMASDVNGRRRDLEAGTDSEGGYTVQTDLGGMIELLRNKTKVLELGATQLTGLQGNLSLPRLDGGATASWVDEEGSVSETAQTFGQLALTPNRLAARTAYSDQLLAQSSISVEAEVRADLMRVTAIELDRAALHGSGTSNEPLGLDGTSGIGTLTFGGAPTWADVVEFETDVSAANGLTGNAAFLSSSSTRGKWKTTVKVASTDSIFLLNGNEANGYDFHVSENVTGHIVFFGVWSQLLVATWGAMSLIVDPYTKAQTGQRVVTACSFHDIACRQPSSFSVSADAGNQ